MKSYEDTVLSSEHWKEKERDLRTQQMKNTIAEQAATIERFRAFVSEYNNKSQTVEDFRRFWAAHDAITPADMGVK